MNSFPPTLHSKYNNIFYSMYEKKCLGTLRKNIYNHMIKSTEKDYFDIDVFNISTGISKEITTKLLIIVLPELEMLGWKCKLAYGDTGLFIYKDELPSTCWD